MGSSQATLSVPGFVLLLEIQRPTRRIEHALSVQGRASWCFCSCGQPTQQLAGKKRGNAGSEWDGHLLPGVTDQQHMVEQVLSYGVKCQGEAEECSDVILLDCGWRSSIFWCARMRRLSHSNGGASWFHETLKMGMFGVVRSHNSKEANTWKIGNIESRVICWRGCSQTVSEGEKQWKRWLR